MQSRPHRTGLLLSDRFVEVPSEEESLRGKEEAGHAGGIDEDDSPESSGIAQELRDHTANENAEAHTDIPGYEDGAVCSASLIIPSHIDSHVLEGRPHVPIAEADEQGGTVISNGSE